MKLTKSKLREIIREEIQKLNESKAPFGEYTKDVMKLLKTKKLGFNKQSTLKRLTKIASSSEWKGHKEAKVILDLIVKPKSINLSGYKKGGRALNVATHFEAIDDDNYTILFYLMISKLDDSVPAVKTMIEKSSEKDIKKYWADGFRKMNAL